MSFRELAEHAESGHVSVEPLITHLFQRVIDHNNFVAGFLCRWHADTRTADVLSAHGIPTEPFRGSRNAALAQFVGQCVNVRCATHVHKCSDTPLWNALERLTNISAWRHQALFVPAFAGDYDFVMVAFSDSDNQMTIANEMRHDVADMVNSVALLLSASEMTERVRITELYVREVGHDIASSVQAIIAKLRAVSRGLLKGESAMVKIREAEQEMMAAYRSADTLGVTVDPDYNLSSADWFNLSAAVREVSDLCRSEAEERHIEIRIEMPGDDIELWGDQKAIQSAITQLLLNAIKYARGSSYVVMVLDADENHVEIRVVDRGVPLDAEERLHMWDFGWRGKRAKELHVNGSGIGLYTVKKIVRAHGGRWGSVTTPKAEDVATFFVNLPKKQRDHRTR
ncbi:MAG TPA: HAMP domain-containing sensor histidine kinase [Gemmataceae bacterium]|nr:HAMP domain-containing sensor histidine kinase [Terracidiphilus sp.]HWB10566.1 HAMP domain-containing sensor histidine kinase [Pirellulales bacterium]HZZ76916.1 HAMP domain-containing sensor histidine kinase [Gemmataceae bacterium]